MSSKSSFKPQKVDLKPREPRQLPEIEKEFQQKVLFLGDAEYKRFVQEMEVERLSKEILSLNNEAHARKELDAKKETSNEQA